MDACLFLGSLDDKTFEYPYGDGRRINGMDFLVNYLLLDDRKIIIEEGFLLAAGESYNHLLEKVIRKGLVLVASRTGNFADYHEDRKFHNHAVNPYMASRLPQLQASCERHKAFLNYPTGDLDQITMKRIGERFLESVGCGITFDFDAAYLHQSYKVLMDDYRRIYDEGGSRSTARASWEAAARTFVETYTRSHDLRYTLLRRLMCHANQERQIVRAAAFAKSNNCPVSVQTGLLNIPADFAVPSRRLETRPIPMLELGKNFVATRKNALIDIMDSQSFKSARADYILSRNQFARRDPGATEEVLKVRIGAYKDTILALLKQKPASEDPSYGFVRDTIAEEAVAIVITAPIVEKLGEELAGKIHERLPPHSVSRRGFLNIGKKIGYVVGAVTTHIAAESLQTIMDAHVDDELIHDAANLEIRSDINYGVYDVDLTAANVLY